MREEREIDAAVIDGVVFDLDGVITRSESVHHVSWEQLFNEYLEDRSARLQEPFEPFQPSDYLEFVDGKPRYDGVASFLESRDIFLPWGSAEDSEDAETVCGLGNRKNLIFDWFGSGRCLIKQFFHQVKHLLHAKSSCC